MTFLPLAAILLCQCATAATYYVATTGSDSNPGTQTAPLRHLSKAAATAKYPGDTVIVMDGTYDNEGVVDSPCGNGNTVVTLNYSGTSGSPITFEAQHRGMAILDSMNTATGTTCNGAYAYFNLYNASFIVIRGFVITRGASAGFLSNNAAHDITIQWNEIKDIANHEVDTQIGQDGIYLNTTEYNFTFDGNSWHDIGRTSGVTPMHFDHGIYSHAQNVTITNNVFYNMTRGWSIQLADGASNWLIANNDFVFPDTSDGEAGQIMFWGNNPNITLENNIFYNPNSAALTQYQATLTGCVFNHNIVYGVSTVLSGGGCTVGSNLMGANPAFVNVSSAPYNFQVQAGGPGIDAGVNLAAVPNDFAGTTRPQGSSTDVGMYEYIPVVGTPAPVISGVFTSGITTTSAIISWSTDQPSTSYANYGLLNYTNSTPVDSTLITQHSVTLSNLAASTLYHFQVASTNATASTGYSSDSTFTTAAIPIVPLTFSLSAAAAQLSVVQGKAANTAVTATLVTGTAAPVTFVTSSLPAGVTAGFSSSSCTVTCSTTLKLSASASAAVGTYATTVTGSNGSASASKTISLTISGSNTTSGLMALWDFSELAGTTTADSSGNGNTGTLHSITWAGTVPPRKSVCSGCILLNGSSSYVSVLESTSLETTTQMTVSMWLRAISQTAVDPRVVSKLYSWDVKLNGANRFPQFSAGGLYGMLNYSLPTNQWQHVVFTFSSGVLAGYVNGVPVAFAANTFTAGTALPLQEYGLFLGTDASQTAFYGGFMDDVRIYNRALTAADVAALYSTTLH